MGRRRRWIREGARGRGEKRIRFQERLVERVHVSLPSRACHCDETGQIRAQKKKKKMSKKLQSMRNSERRAIRRVRDVWSAQASQNRATCCCASFR